MDKSTEFSQERYDSIRGYRNIELGRVTAAEVAKLLFEELEYLRKFRLLPYVVAGPETGVSFYGGRRTIAFSKMDLHGVKICLIETVVLEPPGKHYLPGSREYWGALSIGYRAASHEAFWLWTKFWYPSPTDHADATTVRLTEYELSELLRANPLHGISQDFNNTYSRYVRVIGDKVDGLQKAAKDLSGVFYRGSGRSSRI